MPCPILGRPGPRIIMLLCVLTFALLISYSRLRSLSKRELHEQAGRVLNSFVERLRIVSRIKDYIKTQTTDSTKMVPVAYSTTFNDYTKARRSTSAKLVPVAYKATLKTTSTAKMVPVAYNTTLQTTETPSSSPGTWKTILFWSMWFGYKWNESFRLANATELKAKGCPSWRCHFSYNHSLGHSADAVVFSSPQLVPNNLPSPPRPWYQRWVWVHHESQNSPITRSLLNGIRIHNYSRLINWTMTYHAGSDVIGSYGYFTSLGASSRPLRPNLMSSHGAAMQRYQAALKAGRTLKDVMGPAWSNFVSRPRVVAWMSSHCPTQSRREEYVKELQKYMKVDTYGGCGTKRCLPAGPLSEPCWRNELGTNFSFYLSMENSLCEDYITEKLYNPLYFNIVPVVWGGADYDRYLPPHSYINARHYHPRDLAALLLRLHKNPIEYGRYHLWRGYFNVYVRGNLCELCHLLHTSTTPSHHTDIGAWFMAKDMCESAAKDILKSKSNTTEKTSS